MCGIVCKFNYDGSAVNNDIIQQFDKQRSRGTDGFGLFDGEYMHLIRTATEDKILKWLCKYDSNMILFHHRYPTSTVNVARAAHPISTGKYFGKKQYIMVHNGVLRNENDLFTAHQELGIEYRTLLPDLTFNDSEALLWDLALTLEGKQPELKVIGSMAFILLEKQDGKLVKMHFGRNSRPMNLYKDRETIELSSEGRGDEIDKDKLYTYHYKSKRITTKAMEFKEFKIIDWTKADDDIVRSWNANQYTDDEFGDDYENQLNNYDSYDEWLIAKEARQQLSSVEAVSVKNVLEMHKDKDGSWQTITDLERYPSESEVQDKALNYLAAAQGSFELAYWAVEDEYHEALETNDMYEIVLLERVMEFICSDKEYEDEDSISSLWSNVCQQQQLS